MLHYHRIPMLNLIGLAHMRTCIDAFIDSCLSSFCAEKFSLIAPFTDLYLNSTHSMGILMKVHPDR